MRDRQKCHDCGALEGQVHQPGCDMEVCPFCGRQLITCNCAYNFLGILDTKKYGPETSFLPPEIFENGLTEEQIERWNQILIEKGLIPYIRYPIICARCGKLWPEFFRVSDEEWAHYIQPDKRDEVVCLECYEWIKQVINEPEAQV